MEKRHGGRFGLFETDTLPAQFLLYLRAPLRTDPLAARGVLLHLAALLQDDGALADQLGLAALYRRQIHGKQRPIRGRRPDANQSQRAHDPVRLPPPYGGGDVVKHRREAHASDSSPADRYSYSERSPFLEVVTHHDGRGDVHHSVAQARHEAVREEAYVQRAGEGGQKTGGSADDASDDADLPVAVAIY